MARPGRLRVDLADAVARRRMVRAYRSEPVDRATLDRVLGLALRAPSAGNTQAIDLLVLESGQERERYWATTLSAERRPGFRWQELLAAPVLVVVVTRPEAYVERYGESDKVQSGLGGGLSEWSVPYWWVDAGAVVQNLLLLAVSEGLGACFFGTFEHEKALRDAFEIPEGFRLVGTVAVGHPAPDEPGRSAGRRRRRFDHVVHRGSWSSS